MKEFYCLIVIMLCLVLGLEAQDKGKLYPFLIHGTVNTDSGTMMLEPLATNGYYPDTIQMFAKVKNGNFTFRGSIPYSYGFYISYGRHKEYLSGFFIIDPGEQTLTCNIDSSRKTPLMINNSMSEYFKDYVNESFPLKIRTNLWYEKYALLDKTYGAKIPEIEKFAMQKELKSIYNSGDSLLLHYTIEHPNSQFAFWSLIRLLPFGYEDIFPSIYNHFSNALKHNIAGRVLIADLQTAGSLVVGHKFPYISCIDKTGKRAVEPFSIKHKYTLVDFWYSSCGPCRAQFPDLKDIYSKFKNKGFEIVSISTDKTIKRKEWIKAIKDQGLTWPQYWDKNGSEAAKTYILAFPTNCLIDNNGIIVKKNISPPELATFLKTL